MLFSHGFDMEGVEYLRKLERSVLCCGVYDSIVSALAGGLGGYALKEALTSDASQTSPWVLVGGVVGLCVGFGKALFDEFSFSRLARHERELEHLHSVSDMDGTEYLVAESRIDLEGNRHRTIFAKTEDGTYQRMDILREKELERVGKGHQEDLITLSSRYDSIEKRVEEVLTAKK